MIIDLSKYPAYTSKQKLLPLKSALQLEEPFITKIDTPISYKVDNQGIWYLNAKDWKFAQKYEHGLDYIWYKRVNRETLVEIPDNLYLPYINKDRVTLPYSYYSKAYFPALSLIYKKDMTASTISFSIDALGRLHCESGHWALVQAIEEKLMFIDAKLDLTKQVPVTPMNLVAEANKALNPNYIIFDFGIGDYYNWYAKPNTIAQDLLKKINKDILEFFIPYIYTLEEFTQVRTQPEIYKTLNGWIFPDGSYLFFKSTVLYHNLFLARLCWLPYSYDEKNNWIKLDAIRDKNITDVSYNKKLITPEAKKSLNLITKNFYIEEFDIRSGRRELF